MTRLTDAYMNAIARSMAPTLDRASTCRATGNHRVASNDEPELFVDRGPLTMPSELSESEATEIDRAMEADKKANGWHRRNDAHALDLQIQMQGCIGDLPR